jgi:hypothetical protein
MFNVADSVRIGWMLVGRKPALGQTRVPEGSDNHPNIGSLPHGQTLHTGRPCNVIAELLDSCTEL